MISERRGIAAAVVIGVIALLAGCTSPPATSPPVTQSPTADVVVPAIDGDAVTASDLEADPWVVAARDALLGRVLARNAADFSIAPLADTWSESRRDSLYSTFVAELDDGLDTAVQPGPDALLPLRIETLGETTIVVFCQAGDIWPDADASTLASGSETSLSLVETDGVREAVGWTTAGPACDATGAAIGRFDPEPVRAAALTAADVVPPADSTD